MMSSEIPATCPHCAAGPYAGVPYNKELAAKTRLLRRELGGSQRLAAAFDLERVELRPSPAREGYRGSVKLVFGWDKAAKEAMLGLYEPGSHRLTDLRDCREHDPRLAPLLEAVRRGVKERGLPVYREEGGKGFLRHMLARVLPDGRQLACFVTPHAEGGWQETLEEWARDLRAGLPELFSVCQNLNPGRGNAVLGAVTTLLEGQFTVPCRFLETPVAVSATSFQQANLPVFRAILEELRGWVDGLGAEARVADLYCGCGAIGLSVTRRQPLFLLEADHASQIPLMEAARADGREEINVTRGRVEDCLTSLELFEPDLVIVDPPRKGLDPAQARDLEVLLADPAWRVESVTGFDMLPGTERLECLTLLRR